MTWKPAAAQVLDKFAHPEKNSTTHHALTKGFTLGWNIFGPALRAEEAPPSIELGRLPADVETADAGEHGLRIGEPTSRCSIGPAS